jgi:hypothetical protein
MYAALVAFVLTLQAAPSQPTPSSIVRVFLDCGDGGCHQDYLREEIEFVEYVRDRSDADVHLLVTTAETGSRGVEHTLAFIGLGRFADRQRTLRTVSLPADTEDVVRRRLANAVTLGLLDYVTAGGIPDALEVSASLERSASQAAAATNDPWRRWIFSIEGNAELEAEESQRQREWRVSFGADRITEAWKTTVGVNFNQSREEFDLDEDEPLSVDRHDRSVDALVVKSLGEHWSMGLSVDARSSTFDNTAFSAAIAPAIEWNFFPYSMYTRRQLRALYSIGVRHARYHEITLFDRLRETRAGQELSMTYEQREPWGTLEGRVEWSNFFPGFNLHRIDADTEISIRIARGLSVSLEASASRIRDQLSLPRRDATPEEVLLRLRQLQSGYEFNVSFGIEYQFGSAFASIVNPRFGR